MMRITANDKTIEFDDGKLTFAEGRALEKVTGSPFMELAERKFMGNLTETQALVWVVFKRSEPTLRFSDLDEWNIGGIEIDLNADAPDVEQEEEVPAESDPTHADDPTGTADLGSTAPDGATQP